MMGGIGQTCLYCRNYQRLNFRRIYRYGRRREKTIKRLTKEEAQALLAEELARYDDDDMDIIADDYRRMREEQVC